MKLPCHQLLHRFQPLLCLPRRMSRAPNSTAVASRAEAAVADEAGGAVAVAVTRNASRRIWEGMNTSMYGNSPFADTRFETREC
jgi:hypothetical protein